MKLEQGTYLFTKPEGERMAWVKDAVAGIGAVAFIVCAFELASIAGAIFS